MPPDNTPDPAPLTGTTDAPLGAVELGRRLQVITRAAGMPPIITVGWPLMMVRGSGGWGTGVGDGAGGWMGAWRDIKK